MATATPPVPAAQRFELLLHAWEAINLERELPAVLATVVALLRPIVPVDALAVISFESQLAEPYAMHIERVPPSPGKVPPDPAGRPSLPLTTTIPVRPCLSYEDALMADYAKDPQVYTCPDLWVLEAWYPHEHKLAQGGVRSYLSVPMVVRGRTLGVAVYSRCEPIAFPPEYIDLLRDVSRPLGVALANLLAYDEIRSLRDELAAENVALREKLQQRPPWLQEIVGHSVSIRKLLESIDQVAATDATVLLTGETGTGKELVARAMHRRSTRADGPLVKLNCASIPESLLASELFGHERGAFTGAIERRRGRFEQAHRGTLFLDEIGELPMEVQALLLRVLQEREFERLGGSETLCADVRIIAATNRDLAAEVRAGRFRRDLFYRLNVYPIHLPPLRERRDDIQILAGHFAAKYSALLGRAITSIDRRSLHLLETHDWPGNVRELEHVIERAVIRSRSDTLRIDRDSFPAAISTNDLDQHLEQQEREVIENALRACHGRISGANGAARQLGLPASTLEFRIRRLGIDKFAFRK